MERFYIRIVCTCLQVFILLPTVFYMTLHGEVLYKNCVYLPVGFHSSTYRLYPLHGEVLYKNCVYLPAGFHSSTYSVLWLYMERFYIRIVCTCLQVFILLPTVFYMTLHGEVLYKNCGYLPACFHSSTYSVLYDSTWRGSI